MLDSQNFVNLYKMNLKYGVLGGGSWGTAIVKMLCENNDSINLLNGDKISALIAYYISKKVENLENVAVIHTGYSNNSFVNFINKLGIKTICTATGVKNLHSEALNHDISIYFESNGHGTVLFNKSYENLKDLEKFFHPTIGDGIMDMLGILFILQEKMRMLNSQ